MAAIAEEDYRAFEILDWTSALRHSTGNMEQPRRSCGEAVWTANTHNEIRLLNQ
jgi:hypothetical protein